MKAGGGCPAIVPSCRVREGFITGRCAPSHTHSEQAFATTTSLDIFCEGGWVGLKQIYSHPSTQRPGIRSLHIPTPTLNLVPTYPHILTCHNTRAALATDGTLAVAWRPSVLSL